MEQGVNLERLWGPLAKICSECDYADGPDCNPQKCFISFAKTVIDYSRTKGVTEIPGIHKLIPPQDLKPYYKDLVSEGLAITCQECRQCRENHSPDCVVALVRTSLEGTVLPEHLDYPGSVLVYLAKVKELDPELAEFIAAKMAKK